MGRMHQQTNRREEWNERDGGMERKVVRQRC
jgi:hypothetical protein